MPATNQTLALDCRGGAIERGDLCLIVGDEDPFLGLDLEVLGEGAEAGTVRGRLLAEDEADECVAAATDEELRERSYDPGACTGVWAARDLLIVRRSAELLARTNTAEAGRPAHPPSHDNDGGDDAMTHEHDDTTTTHSAALEELRLPELQRRYAEVLGEQTRSPNRTFLIRKITEALQAKAGGVDGEEPAGVNEPEPRLRRRARILTPKRRQAAETRAAGDAVAALPAEAIDLANPASERDTSHDGASNAAMPEPPDVAAPAPKLTKLSVDELRAKYVEVVGRPTDSTHRGYLVWKIREAQKGRVPVGPKQARRTEAGTSEFKVLPLRLEADAVEQMDTAWRRQGIASRSEFFRRAVGAYLASLGEAEAAAKFESTAG